MDAEGIEGGLAEALGSGEGTLHEAMRYAVLGAGKRLRPRLMLAVAACHRAEGDRGDLALRAACALELLHCASLVHDDLPAFDDAEVRRGRASVHVRFGEPMAILVGDALISRALEHVAVPAPGLEREALELVRLLAAATGAEGLTGGQSLELLDDPPRDGAGLDRYHALKTGALFGAACEGGAVAAGAGDRAAWREIGLLLGRSFQLYDDVVDTSGDAAVAGKPVGRDAARGTPNAASTHGVEATRARARRLLRRALDRAAAVAAFPHLFLDALAPFTDRLDAAARAPDATEAP